MVLLSVLSVLLMLTAAFLLVRYTMMVLRHGFDTYALERLTKIEETLKQHDLDLDNLDLRYGQLHDSLQRGVNRVATARSRAEQANAEFQHNLEREAEKKEQKNNGLPHFHLPK